MFEYLYEWIGNIAFYLVLVTAVIQILPNNDYKKYIRFFTGLVLILLLVTPVFKVLGMEHKLSELYDGKEYKKEMEKIEGATDYLKEVDGTEYLKDAEEEEVTGEIEVEEIQSGQ